MSYHNEGLTVRQRSDIKAHLDTLPHLQGARERGYDDRIFAIAPDLKVTAQAIDDLYAPMYKQIRICYRLHRLYRDWFMWSAAHDDGELLFVGEPFENHATAALYDSKVMRQWLS